MYAFLLQDWVTIRSASGGAITQGEANWLDLSAFLDVIVFMETKNFAVSSGVLYMAYQTGPTKDEVLFQPMVDISTSTSTTAIAVGVQTAVLLRDTALCPLARWFRWQLTPPSNAVGITSFESTFRIWISANQPGGYATGRAQMGYGDSRGFGGPAWTQGSAMGATPGTPWHATGGIQLESNVPLHGNASPFAQGPLTGPNRQWWQGVNTIPKPSDPRKNVQRIHHIERPGNIVPYLAPGVKVTTGKPK
jgi:hypothetical protein